MFDHGGNSLINEKYGRNSSNNKKKSCNNNTGKNNNKKKTYVSKSNSSTITPEYLKRDTRVLSFPMSNCPIKSSAIS